MTHLGSDWEKLSAIIEKDNRFNVFQTGNSYSHPEDVKNLTAQIHKRENAASVWVDVILHNKDFTMKLLCDHYKFIFWSCPLEECIDELVKKHKYKVRQAEDYWNYRMAGLRKYYERSPGSLWNPSETDFLSAAIF